MKVPLGGVPGMVSLILLADDGIISNTSTWSEKQGNNGKQMKIIKTNLDHSGDVYDSLRMLLNVPLQGCAASVLRLGLPFRNPPAVTRLTVLLVAHTGERRLDGNDVWRATLRLYLISSPEEGASQHPR